MSAAVYTQTTDCETEVNGLMTYDRELIKMDADKVREANTALIRLLDKPASTASVSTPLTQAIDAAKDVAASLRKS